MKGGRRGGKQAEGNGEEEKEKYGVIIELQGKKIVEFEELFWQQLPPLARVDTFEKNPLHVL